MMTLCPFADIFLMVSLVKSDSLLSELSNVPSKSTAITFFVILFPRIVSLSIVKSIITELRINATSCGIMFPQ